LLYIVITATVMHHIISCHRTVHDVASSLRICRLTNGCASEYSFGLSSVSLIYLVVAGTIGLLFLFFLWCCFSHITMMPRWNLGPHVRCSHMIEPLGACWCQGICDVIHCNLLLYNLTSVPTSNTY